MSGEVIRTEGLTRVYKVLSRGFYDPGVYYETLGGRFLYEVLMRAVVGEVEVRALDGVSIRVRKGEFVCLLGPNGSGKTTLIKILATLIPPTSGRAEVMGYDVEKDRDEVVKHVTYIPSVMGATAWAQLRLTVRQNLRIMSRLFGIDLEEVLGAARRLGLSEVMDRPLGSLSTGQQARVGLLIGILRRTPVYLLDEPMMGLSPEAVRTVKDYLGKLNREFGVTILYATHHPLEIQEEASRVIILRNGRVVADGGVEELIKRAKVEESVQMEVYNAYFDLRHALEGLRELGVRYVSLRGLSPEEGRYEVALGVENADEVLPRLLERLVSEGAKIVRLKVKRANLEDAYLYYVGGTGG
ncbi:ABC transporter ATP-binding protein [Infirmifilum sp. NZ]|uniref:ABC transporter ATP-binding protein n=1 Tax=Infirmifilum sp. NZ TaxID=2926850 RepID=UPI0027A0E944|nr:ABC transporter ATP-binding protein [Infirmifilum sp. NZ]UNQ72538.1 ABC transporter ATP-binding protein [Infirmifilum sp. NZ]